MQIHILSILISITAILAQSCIVREQYTKINRSESQCVLDISVKADIVIKGDKIKFTCVNTTNDQWAIIKGIPVGRDGVFDREYFVFIAGDYVGCSERRLIDPIALIAPGDVYSLRIDLSKNYKNLNIKDTLPPRIPFEVRYALFESRAKALDSIERWRKTGADYFPVNKMSVAPWIKQ